MQRCDTYYNGEYGSFGEMRIPLTDRSIFFGDGIYDAAVGRGDSVYLLSEHIERFTGNAEKTGIPFNMDGDALASLLKDVRERSGYEEYFLYFQLSRYSEERIHAYPNDERSNLLISVKPWHSEERGSVRLISREDVRYQMCNIKTLNLLPAVMASRAAEDAGCAEAVFVRDGIVTECAHSNIMILMGDVLYTHPTDRHILPGITRKRILELCERRGIKYRELPFSYEAMMHADAVLISSTSKLARKVIEIDGVPIPSDKCDTAGSICDMLWEDFQNMTKKVC